MTGNRHYSGSARVTFDGLEMSIWFDDDPDPSEPLRIDLSEDAPIRGQLPQDGDRAFVTATHEDNDTISLDIEPPRGTG